MCGIAGIVWPRGVAAAPAAERVARMLTRERHRGPDDQGVATLTAPDGTERGAIGNVRLAVLDPRPEGRQPMHDPETGDVLVFNGELYNHLDVRRELGPSVQWRTGTDTETLLRAYARWGPSCLDRLRGMFAVAIWSARRQELWCARDRLGIKPLYLWEGPAGFAFASELRALTECGLFRPRLDPEGLRSFVRFGAVSEPRTMFEDVRSLAPGHWTRVVDGRAVETRPYWRPTPPAGRRPSRAAATQVIRDELTRAVEEHLLSDVPVASFLSGGLDSSVVTAIAARRCAGRVATFTLGFRQRTHDESALAEAVARRCGTRHRTVLLEPEEVASRVPRALAAQDQPSVDGVNTWLVSQIVAEAGYKVVLSGLGGDELFGGYPSFRWLPVAERLDALLGVAPSSLLARAAGGGARGARVAAMLSRGASLPRRYEQVRALWSDEELAPLGAAPGAALAGLDLPGFRGTAAVSLLELSGYTRNTLLRDADAMSMAHSLELRVPLLDHRLVEACLDVRAARWTPRGGKALLSPLAAELLPPEVLGQPKRGFALPMDTWMRGPLRSLVVRSMSALLASGVVPGAADLLERFDARRLPWARLWQFVVLGHWLAARGV